MFGRLLIALVLIVEALCAFFFVSSILSSYFGLSARPMSWEVRELTELGAAIGLVLGVITTAVLLVRALRQRARAEAKLKAASSAFMDLLEERFDDWGLTPAERDVAQFALKGFSTAQIAQYRETSEGTVKAQSNAIYRKAGVTGRAQLLSLFIEDLMGDRPAPVARAEKAAEPVAAK